MSLTIKATTTVVRNRQAFEELTLATADGLFALAVEIVDNAHPHDAPPYGEGLVDQGGAVAWVGKKKVAGTTIDGKQIKKPRALRLDAGDVTAIGGYGFPARFHELGTIDTAAYPFLTPSAVEAVPHADATVGAAMRKRLSRMP